MTELFLDFETRSRLDLRKVGAHRYAEDPSTEVVVVAWAVDDGPVRKVVAGSAGGWREEWGRLAEGGMGTFIPLIVAHNAEFERLMLVHKFGLRGPAAEPSRFRCTAAQAARAGLPRGLEAACEALGVDSWDKKRKDRVIRKLSQPRRATGEFWEREDAEEEWGELEADCARDVESCRALYRLLPQLGDREQALWELTVRMNDRGLKVDLPSVRLARDFAAAERERVAAEFQGLVGCEPGSPDARALVPPCSCRARDPGHRSLDKAHVRRYLRDESLPARTHQALELRRRWARSSLAKLDAMLERTSADGRLRGQLVYCGAERTGRWSSRGVQWHNAPRGLGEGTDLAFAALRGGVLGAVYEDPLLTVSDMLKGFLTGPFLLGDYSQIEARDLAWQAGQSDLLAAFAGGEDVYSGMAGVIYKHVVRDFSKTHDPKDYDEKVHIAKRQLGKVAVLGCGYGLGPEGLQRNMEKDFDVLLPDEMAERVVHSFRRRYPRIPELWRELERGFRWAVEHGSKRVRVGPVCMGVEEREGRRWVFIELPSGRRMYYFDPMVELEGQVTYFGRNRYTGKWGRVRTYGGMLTENVVQAEARDVLAEAMLRLDGAGFPLVLQVHDECAAEAPQGLLDPSLAEFKRLMEVRPEWARELPLAVEAHASWRYHK